MREGEIIGMDKIGTRVQEMIQLTFTNKPWGSGVIQGMILDGTIKKAKDISERHLKGFLFPRMRETIEKIVEAAAWKPQNGQKK